MLYFFVKQKTAYEMRSSDWSSYVCSSDLEIAQDWTMRDEAMNEHGRDRPTSLSLVLSMPGGSTDPETLQDAAQAFARILFEDNHAYMLALHTDTDHPHVHLTVATEGADGTR